MGSSVGKSCLTNKEIEDIKSRTHFSASEIQDWYKKFHRDFPGGVIQQKQLITIYSKLYTGGDARKFATRVFRFYDKDGSGDIDFFEFMDCLTMSAKGSHENKLKWLFTLYDMDKDGKLSIADVNDMISALCHLQGDYDRSKSEEIALKVVNDGKNSDSELTAEEFVCGASKYQLFDDTLQMKQ